jgi:hypothetical protein
MKLIYIFVASILAGCVSTTEYDNGQQLDWDVAKSFITLNPHKIENVVQAHSLHVNLLLTNGKVLKTQELYIDEIFDVLSQCGKPCEHIGWITE